MLSCTHGYTTNGSPT